MRTIPLRRLCVLPFCLGILFIAGCPGEKSTTVSGKVLLGKIKLQEGDNARIQLVADQGMGAMATIDTNDSSFNMKNVQPGKYRVIAHFDPYPGQKDAAKRAKEFDVYNQKYDVKSSKLYMEVGDKSETVTIDLAAGTVTKG
jgi:hypothetical protein